MKATCGPVLDGCRCYPGIGITRTATEIRADHRAAVARAKRSGFARQPLPLWLWQTYDPTGFTTTGRWAA